MLQEPVGLGLLEPSPGLGLQGLVSFPRRLVSLSSVLWAGGSPWGLGRCLVRGRVLGGKGAMTSGPAPASTPAAIFSSSSPAPPGCGVETPNPPSYLIVLGYNCPGSPSQGLT